MCVCVWVCVREWLLIQELARAIRTLRQSTAWLLASHCWGCFLWPSTERWQQLAHTPAFIGFTSINMTFESRWAALASHRRSSVYYWIGFIAMEFAFKSLNHSPVWKIRPEMILLVSLEKMLNIKLERNSVLSIVFHSRWIGSLPTWKSEEDLFLSCFSLCELERPWQTQGW